ncbi:MAG TPA: hypothetical protein VF879_02645 [Nitrospirales bacterium]
MLLLMIAFLFGAVEAQPVAKGGPSTCVQCHRELEAELSDPVLQAVGDIHFQKGLSCHDCHGGDPTVGIDTGGPEDSMSRAKGYIGRPARKQIATLCASCHSKLDYMRRYNPQARVDQYTEYLTSVHGKKYVAGDPGVATCVDCHGAHGVRAVKDPNSHVYATNVAATCGRCHADAGRMAPYRIRTDQMFLYSKSVHGEALLKNQDISAPTCNDCHGNHGAAPPGIDAVANVCGQCHAMQWELFNKSAHRKAFFEMGLPACVTCHEHHDVMRTSDAMLGVEASAKCVSCHDRGSAGYTAAGEMKSAVVRLQEHLHKAREVLERGERAGMEVSRPIYDLVEGRDRLVRARVEIHGFDAAAVRKVTEEGERIATGSEQAGWKALADLAYRRKGLAVSVAILLFMIGLLLFKIREIETTDERR